MSTAIIEPPHLAADLKTLCLSTIEASARKVKQGPQVREGLLGSPWQRDSTDDTPRSARCDGCDQSAAPGGWGSRAGRN